MTKFKAMKEHVEARRSIGIKISLLNQLYGYMVMFFTVDQESIEGATRNIRAGNVSYDPKTNMVFVK